MGTGPPLRTLQARDSGRSTMNSRSHDLSEQPGCPASRAVREAGIEAVGTTGRYNSAPESSASGPTTPRPAPRRVAKEIYAQTTHSRRWLVFKRSVIHFIPPKTMNA